MSKQEEAKLSQGYDKQGRSCSNCGMLGYDMVLPKWMQESNDEAKKRGDPERYGEGYREKKKLRCLRGGFAVKALAVCNEHLPIPNS